MKTDQMLNYFRLVGQLKTSITNVKKFEEAVKTLLKSFTSNFNCDYAIYYGLDETKKFLQSSYSIGNLDFTGISYKIGEDVVGKAFEKNVPINQLDKVTNDEILNKRYPNLNVTSRITVPFSCQDEKLGCIDLILTNNNQHYDEETAEMIALISLMYSIEIVEHNILIKEWPFKDIILSGKNIHKEYRSGEIVTKVLKGVNIDVYKGEFLVILGESGCGKTTLLNVLGGMISPTSGSFKFLDKELSTANKKELTLYRKDNIGFIFQQYNLMPTLTAVQNLRLIAELVKNPMDPYEALKLVGLSERANNYPSQLSGGQQQRISIARALIKNPLLIFADEPTAALDYTTSIEVLSVIEKVVMTGTTIVMVTHNEEITKMANRVIRMRDGKLYEITINQKPLPAKELVW